MIEKGGFWGKGEMEEGYGPGYVVGRSAILMLGLCAYRKRIGIRCEVYLCTRNTVVIHRQRWYQSTC